MLEPALTPTCKCGQPMTFKKGVIKTKCTNRQCGMTWERRPDGFWAIGNLTTLFTPIFSKEKVCSVRSRKDRYSNYPKAKRKNGRKAGSRC